MTIFCPRGGNIKIARNTCYVLFLSHPVVQARAQSATELSTSRRLKAELARAFAAQQRQHARGVGTAADVVLSSRSSPLDRQYGGGGGGDTGAGGAIGVGGRGSGGGAVVGAMRAIPGLPPDAISAPTAAAAAGTEGGCGKRGR